MLIDNFAKLGRPLRGTVLAALIIIGAIAMYNWTVAPHTSCLFAVQRCESAISKVTSESEVIHSAIKIKQNNLEKLQTQFVEFQNTFFTPGQAKEFFSDLQAISEEVGCAVYSLNFTTNEAVSKGKKSDGVSEIVAQSAMLSIVGVYSRVAELMQKFQMRTQKVWIDSVRMEAISEDSPELKCDLKITIYTVNNEEAVFDG